MASPGVGLDTHTHAHACAHTPSVWGQGSLGRCSMVHTLRQPVVGSKLFVIGHHIPLLAPVSGFSNLFHLTGDAIYTLLLLRSRKKKKACRDRRERKQQVRHSHSAQEIRLTCTGDMDIPVTALQHVQGGRALSLQDPEGTP